MAEEEPDYLSEEFVTNAACDIRPGLLFRGQKRQHEMAKKQSVADKKSRTKPLRVLEEEKRNQALDSALTSNNRGFALLQKMGYKPGMALGKQGASDAPRLKPIQEPIRPVVKNNRFGLGEEAQQKERVQERVRHLEERHLQQVRHARQLSKDFQSRVRDDRRAKHVARDLTKSQNVCLHLDSQADMESPHQVWFWPPSAIQDQTEKLSDEEEDGDEDDDEDDEKDDSPEQKSDRLKEITSYLRESYFYCLWCGTSYNDTADLEANCPGCTAEDHE